MDNPMSALDEKIGEILREFFTEFMTAASMGEKGGGFQAKKAAIDSIKSTILELVPDQGVQMNDYDYGWKACGDEMKKRIQ